MPLPPRPDLTGQFLHIYHDGLILWQGEIVEVNDDGCAVLLYSWAEESPTQTVFLSVSEVLTRCARYRSREEWLQTGREANAELLRARPQLRSTPLSLEDHLQAAA